MIQSLDHQLQEVNFQYENSQRDLTSEIRYATVHSFDVSFFILIINRSIRAKTLESNEASFIVQEMIPAYRAAVTSQGKSNKRLRTRRLKFSNNANGQKALTRPKLSAT